MPSAPLPPDEDARLATLQTYDILDTLPEGVFDDLVGLASELCGVPIALVSLIDRDRQWFKAAVGLEITETPRDVAFCAHAILGDELLVVPDARADARFADNPLVIAAPAVRFYAGTPLRTPEGHALGTLCVIDRVVRELTPFQRRALRTIGRQVEAQLELRRSVRALRTAAQAERRYELLRERTRDIILFLSPDGRILDANDAALQAYGYDRDGLQALEIRDLRAPATQADVEVMLARARAGGFVFETLHRRRDGTLFPVEVSVQPAGDGGDGLLVSIVRDITDRRASEAALRLRDRAFAASPSGILITDARAPDDPVLYVNPSFERITGYTAAEALGRNCRFLQGDARDQPGLTELRAAVRERRGCCVVLRNFRKDGTPFWNELTLAPVHDEGGEPTHFIGVQTDVTGRVQAEADRAALADLRARQNVLLEQELTRRTEQLLRADRLATLGTLAGGVGHELNNITGILLAYLGFVRERADTGLPPEPEDLTALDRAAEHVRIHAAHLLSLGRPGPDRAERVDLREVVTTTLGMLATVGRTRPVQVEVEAPAHPVPVTVNRSRIEQVLVNLVGNAVDALVETRDRDRRVRVVLEPDALGGGAGRVHCRVEDNGTGIPADRLAQIFEPYFTTKAPGRGTGLGLPVVRQIVEAYGGALTVASREGEGTTFAFDLPMEPPGTG